MPTITLNISYTVNTSSSFSAQDLRDKYLSGLPNDFDGSSIPDETIEFYIESAKTQLESMLGLKLDRQLIEETFDYTMDDWMKWGFMKMTYPVQFPVSIDGYLGNLKHITYPKEWMSAKKSNDGRSFNRELRLIPVGGAVSYGSTGNSPIFLGFMTPQLSWWRSNRNVPNYWHVSYVTGWPDDKIPMDILQALGMMAAIPILGIISDRYAATRGMGLGVSSKSLSIDGLSQSTSGFASGQKGIFGARQSQYSDALNGEKGKGGLLDILKDSYSAVIFCVC